MNDAYAMESCLQKMEKTDVLGETFTRQLYSQAQYRNVCYLFLLFKFKETVTSLNFVFKCIQIYLKYPNANQRIHLKFDVI